MVGHPTISGIHQAIIMKIFLCGQAGIDGAIIVTTPQEVALLDVRKEINFCRKVGIPIIGVVENMSWFVCPKCTKTSEIFPPSSGGAEEMAKCMDVKLLGKIPLDPRLAKCCDEGKSFLDELPNSPASRAYIDIANAVTKYCNRDNGTIAY